MIMIGEGGVRMLLCEMGKRTWKIQLRFLCERKHSGKTSYSQKPSAYFLRNRRILDSTYLMIQYCINQAVQKGLIYFPYK